MSRDTFDVSDFEKLTFSDKMSGKQVFDICIRHVPFCINCSRNKSSFTYYQEKNKWRVKYNGIYCHTCFKTKTTKRKSEEKPLIDLPIYPFEVNHIIANSSTGELYVKKQELEQEIKQIDELIRMRIDKQLFPHIDNEIIPHIDRLSSG